MRVDLRTTIHQAIDRLPDEQLADVWQVLRLLATSESAALEAEDVLLLVSGALKQMNDELDDTPAPVDDWKTFLSFV